MTTDTKPSRKLTDRQQKFINFVATGTMSAAEAYRQAGYSPLGASVEASRALALPHIAKAVAERKAQLQGTNTLATPEFVMQTLVREAQGAGPDTTSAARVSATKVLADILGLQNSNAQATDGFKQMLEALGRGIQAQKEAKYVQNPAKHEAKEALEGTYRLSEARTDAVEEDTQAHERAREAGGTP